MDYGELAKDAFTFMKEGVFKDAGKWLRLILAVILIGIPMNGYIMRIYRGTETAPEVDRWGNLIVDGIKLMIVGLIYAIPIIVLWIVIYGPLIGALLDIGRGGSPALGTMGKFAPNLGLLALFYIFEILLAILLPIAGIRFARTGSFAEAFNFRAILETIGKIGWINYIIALIFVAIIVGIPVAVLVFIFIILAVIVLAIVGFSVTGIFCVITAGIALLLIIMPLLAVFQARFMTRVYDSPERAVAVPSAPLAVWVPVE